MLAASGRKQLTKEPDGLADGLAVELSKQALGGAFRTDFQTQLRIWSRYFRKAVLPDLS